MEAMTFVFAILIFLGLVVTRMTLTEVQSRVATLTRVEAKLDLLLQHANLRYDPYANVPDEVAEAVRQGQKIKAIKLYRHASGVGLKEAKDFVEGVQRRAGV